MKNIKQSTLIIGIVVVALAAAGLYCLLQLKDNRGTEAASAAGDTATSTSGPGANREGWSDGDMPPNGGPPEEFDGDRPEPPEGGFEGGPRGPGGNPPEMNDTTQS